jgi:hypothetical protein
MKLEEFGYALTDASEYSLSSPQPACAVHERMH